MIKICPECISINVDLETCKSCGFPFNKKIIGRFEDYYFYEIIEMVNLGQIEKAKLKILEKKKQISDTKLEILTEKVSNVEELVNSAEIYAVSAISNLNNNNYDLALEQIKLAHAIYTNPKFAEIEKSINGALKKEQDLLLAENKFQQALTALKNNETIYALNLLKELLSSDAENQKIKSTYEEEVKKFLATSIVNIKLLIASKKTKEADLLLFEILPFAANSPEFLELRIKIDNLYKRKKTKKRILLLLVSIVLISTSYLFLIKLMEYNKENEKWQAIVDQNNIEAYQVFMNENKESKYFPSAQKKLQELVSKDSSLWNDFLTSTQRFDLEKYIAIMEKSSGTHIAEAKIRIDSLDWMAISKNGGIAAYEQYLQKHPYGNFAEIARYKISHEPSEDEKYELLRYITSYFTAYENRDLETVMMYFSAITPSFGSQKNLTKADIRLIFENDLKSISISTSKIDSTSFLIKKNEDGELSITFNSDRYITRLKTEIIDGTETEQTLSYYINTDWFLKLDENRKIKSYKFKPISEQQIN